MLPQYETFFDLAKLGYQVGLVDTRKVYLQLETNNPYTYLPNMFPFIRKCLNHDTYLLRHFSYSSTKIFTHLGTWVDHTGFAMLKFQRVRFHQCKTSYSFDDLEGGDRGDRYPRNEVISKNCARFFTLYT